VRRGIDLRADRRRDARAGRLVATVLAGLAVAGCAGSSAPSAIYDLTAVASDVGGRTHRGVQILVPEPRALKALDGDSIAVRPTAQTISYYGKVQWADRLPKLLQARVVQSFEDSGRVRAAGFPGEGLLINYQLPIEIRHFQLESGGAPTAVIEVAVKLLNDATGTVVATRVFRAEVRAGGDTAGAAVTALDAALKQILDELVVWTVTAI